MRSGVGADITYSYDSEFDVLYVSLGSPRESYCREPVEGFLIRHSLADDSFTGVTVLEFARRLREGSLPDIRLPVTVDFWEIGRRLRLLL